VTRGLLLVAFALILGACAQDDPTVGVQPEEPSGEQDSPSLKPQWTVTAIEYAFKGAPVLLSEGEFTFTLKNDGEEPHELYLAHITGPQSIEELIELPEEEVAELTQAVDRAEAAPGESAEFTAALVPGRFGYVCFVEAEDGTPHAFLGMVGEFTVA
jgi:uncharacterized cupredoxin-like copper-binding protein